METQNRMEFEEAWKRAMDGAEAPLPPGIWDNIEDRLDNPGRTARHILLIKFAIAASFLFAMSTAGLYFYKSPGSLNNLPPFTKETSDSYDNAQITENDVNGSDLLETGLKQRKDVSTLWQDAVNIGRVSLDEISSNTADLLNGISAGLFVPDVANEVEMNKIPILPAGRAGQLSSPWAGVQISGGPMGLNSNESVAIYQVADFESANKAMFVSRTETSDPRNSFNIGIGVGKELSSKWVLQGGINYTVRHASGTSNVVTESNNIAFNVGSGEVVATEPYQIEHRLAYISVPVQAGYRLIDKKLDVVVLAGLAGDMRVSHRISDQDGDYNPIRVDEESDFNKYAASAVFTAEVSYPLGQHYRISAYPQVRKYLTPLQQNGSLPLSTEFGVRLSYLF